MEEPVAVFHLCQHKAVAHVIERVEGASTYNDIGLCNDLVAYQQQVVGNVAAVVSRVQLGEGGGYYLQPFFIYKTIAAVFIEGHEVSFVQGAGLAQGVIPEWVYG